MIVLLDSGPLGLITQPHITPSHLACRRWLDDVLTDGISVVIPEIIDYEIRRELLRADRIAGLGRLDELHETLGTIPVSSAARGMAAQFWADARRTGRATRDDKDLDVDVILAAQTEELRQAGEETCVATTNVRHLALFTVARDWTRWNNEG